MSHQPFETWILDNPELSTEERRSLQGHLEACQQCQRLSRKWQAVQPELKARVLMAPPEGFTQRWSSRLAERRARHQRRQAWKAFLAFLGAAFTILLVLVGYTVATSSPADWLAVVIRYSAFSLNLVDLFISGIRFWLASTPLALNVALWIYATITLCILSGIWVLALWRTSIVGVFNK